MKKLLLFALLCALPIRAQLTLVHPDKTLVTGFQITDAAGNPLPSGTITFTPTNAQGQPMSFRGGPGGQRVYTPASAQVTNGAFSIYLDDVSTTSPSYLCYQVSVVNNATHKQVLGGPDYSCIQPTGANYSFDNYSTSSTPILEHAGQQIEGDTGINGNLAITGNISAGSINTTGVINAAVTNGIVNAATFAGSTIDAQVAAAVAAACPTGTNSDANCTVMIPPGKYTYANTIVTPPLRRFTLLMDGATLTYTGNGAALSTSIAANSVFIHGGVINGNPSAKFGIVLAAATQGCFVENTDVELFTNGIGLVDFGCNVVTLLNNNFSSNLIGAHMLGSNGYASNAVKAIGNRFIENYREGLVDGDISIYPPGWPGGLGAGHSSPNFNNLYMGNDFELNGRSDTSSVHYPAVRLGLTNAVTLANNYFEATNGTEIQIGCNLSTGDTAYSTLYGVAGPECGTSVGAQVINNYFTPNGAQFTSGGPVVGDEIQLTAAINTTVTGNSEAPATSGVLASACFVDINAATASYINANQVTASSQFCQGGIAMSAGLYSAFVGVNHNALDLAIDGQNLYFNPQGYPGGAVTNTGAVVGGHFIRMDMKGPPVPSNPENPGGNPFCSPAFGAGSLWLEGTLGTEWLCVSDTIAPGGGGFGNSADGNSTWVKK